VSEWFGHYWPLVTVVLAAIALVASAHVVLNKRDVRAALGWSGLILFSPLIGSLLYMVLGINRIQRRAARLRDTALGEEPLEIDHACCSEIGLPDELERLCGFVGRVVSLPLTVGNAIDPLESGDVAFPAMLKAIDEAERSVVLETYIFDYDRAGARFVDALVAAAKRGVEVRVLVDGVGAKYSRPRITHVLRRRGVRVEEFLSSLSPRSAYWNLRNHRKILVVDGRVGFAGGMNIREGNLLVEAPSSPIQDLQFRIEGPVVEHLMRVFAEDWMFTTGESFAGDAWKVVRDPAGPVAARGVPDGPDEDFEMLRWTLLGALSEASRSVRIATPYFLPEQPLITALNVAAMRGVAVEILLPEKGNLRTVQWAATAQLWQVLERGCRVWLTPPPFDHTKLMLVDDGWSLIGSGNWDPRSLRLNFEFNVECYDRGLAGRLGRLLDRKKQRAREVTLAEVDARPLPVRLRDGVARLLLPYL
jgi:cardiolipin synthase